MPMTKIRIQCTLWLANLREPSSPVHKSKIYLLHYDFLYIYIKLNVLKLISEEKFKTRIEEIQQIL